MFAAREEGGFTTGRYNQEQRLNLLPGSVNVVHLRPPFFMENFLGSINAIRKAGVIAYPIKLKIAFPMIATQDIASEAARLLLDLNFSGKSAKTLLEQRDVSTTEAAKVIGKTIDKDVRYVQVSYEEHTKALVGAGISPSAANTLTGMCRHLNEGTGIPIEKRSNENTTPDINRTICPEIRGHLEQQLGAQWEPCFSFHKDGGFERPCHLGLALWIVF